MKDQFNCTADQPVEISVPADFDMSGRDTDKCYGQLFIQNIAPCTLTLAAPENLRQIKIAQRQSAFPVTLRPGQFIALCYHMQTGDAPDAGGGNAEIPFSIQPDLAAIRRFRRLGFGTRLLAWFRNSTANSQPAPTTGRIYLRCGKEWRREKVLVHASIDGCAAFGDINPAGLIDTASPRQRPDENRFDDLRYCISPADKTDQTNKTSKPANQYDALSKSWLVGVPAHDIAWRIDNGRLIPAWQKAGMEDSSAPAFDTRFLSGDPGVIVMRENAS